MTENQVKIMTMLDEGPKTARQLTDILQPTNLKSILWTYDQIHSILRRLEDRSFVRRFGDRPFYWELTRVGRRAVNL